MSEECVVVSGIRIAGSPAGKDAGELYKRQCMFL
jgi:hypothetical protein